jgi:hypothetical protein
MPNKSMFVQYTTAPLEAVQFDNFPNHDTIHWQDGSITVLRHLWRTDSKFRQLQPGDWIVKAHGETNVAIISDTEFKRNFENHPLELIMRDESIMSSVHALNKLSSVSRDILFAHGTVQIPPESSKINESRWHPTSDGQLQHDETGRLRDAKLPQISEIEKELKKAQPTSLAWRLSDDD